MSFQEFKNHVLDKIDVKENTSIMESSDQLRLDTIENGVLAVWVRWSPGYINCANAINHLYSLDYKGQINIIETDSLSKDFQIKTFGKVLHGWGEIFVIKNGQIEKEFREKESSQSFKTYFEQFIQE
jgi:hypothetical protein